MEAVARQAAKVAGGTVAEGRAAVPMVAAALEVGSAVVGLMAAAKAAAWEEACMVAETVAPTVAAEKGAQRVVVVRAEVKQVAVD